jgi:peptidoglycan hydrolase CwlO-like protein
MGAIMQESRRSNLRMIARATIALLVAVSAGHGQEPFPTKRTPVRPGDDDANPNPNVKDTTKLRLEDNQKDIRKNIEKLFELASQLKEQVEKTDATTVLSLAMVKKAEEIEKLARQIKERAKG